MLRPVSQHECRNRRHHPRQTLRHDLLRWPTEEVVLKAPVIDIAERAITCTSSTEVTFAGTNEMGHKGGHHDHHMHGVAERSVRHH